MAYDKTTWNSGAAPGIDADKLNNLETQYDAMCGILTTRGDIYKRGVSTVERLAKGNPGQVLTMGADEPQWSALPAFVLLSLLSARGDLPCRGASTWEKLAKGSSGQVLTMGTDDPGWVTPPLWATAGNRTGANSDDSAVAHGLGKTPKLVVIVDDDGDLFIQVQDRHYLYLFGKNAVSGCSMSAVTALDATHFHVGTSYGNPWVVSANAAGRNYWWVALG